MNLPLGVTPVREQDPAGVDVANDLPKSGGLYIAAAGLATRNTAAFNGLAAGGLGTGRTTIFGATPAGKTRYVTALMLSSDGAGLCELDVDGAGVAFIRTPAAGGTVTLPLEIPWRVEEGQTCGYTTQNTDSVARSQAVLMTVVEL